ncbi:MAG: endonuclease/exonuclease/phosphatase family protein [Acidimicrobiales bacterium]
MPELTLASFNVHWGLGHHRRGFPPFDVASACETFDADVIVLQESWAPDGGVAQHDEVAKRLGMQCVAVPLARSSVTPTPHLDGRAGAPGGEGSWCLALLSRKPIRSTRTVDLRQLFLDPSSRVLLHAEIDVDGTNLTVVATHFSHLEFGSPLQTRGLRRGLPPADRPAALVGDMNMWGWTIDAMTPPGWRRVVRGKTWPAPRPRHQIDHLLVTPPVEVVRSEVLPDLGSDHLPIRARLRVT